mmetsp:Transcript_23466/g.54732  ORF Transcript_23466/g.54732 Transcript_23466/m.54732 type:complete len:871 (+) Transcript_23466:91-2703(+)
MATSPVLLHALEKATGTEIFYFEIVMIHNGPRDDIRQRRCLMCLSRHSIIFMREDLSIKIHAGGELMYAHISNVVTDANSSNLILLSLSDNRPQEWESDRLYVHAENRVRCIRYLRASYQADFIWRMGKCSAFPLSSYPLTQAKVTQPSTAAFANFQWRDNGIYKFMVSDTFSPFDVAGERLAVFKDNAGRKIEVTVHERKTQDMLAMEGRDHIRWVAGAYKQHLLEDVDHFYILTNQQYRKSMNLSGDPSAWMAWEFNYRTEDTVVFCIILRRQHIPPILDSTDDASVIMTCPAAAATPQKLSAWQRENRLVADTFRPQADSFSVYWAFIQAKLDTLHFDEESSMWISSHFKLHTCWREEAKIFLRKILRLFIDDAAFKDTDDIMNKSAQEVLVFPHKDETWCELDDSPDNMEEFLQSLRTKGKGLPDEDDAEVAALYGLDDSGKPLRIRHRWLFRIANYFAWACDGGLLGAKFTIDTMLEHTHGLTDKGLKLVMKALEFMLHIRPTDFTKPWTDDGKMRQIGSISSFAGWTFNDRVMQSIVNTEYLRKQFGRNKDEDYCKCLARLFEADSSLTLKSSICRRFMDTQFHEVDEAMRVVIPHLINMLKTEGLFLATYACATLVNLSQNNDGAKQLIMSAGIGKIAVKQVATKEEDLVLYTMMLLVNCTKEAQHRYIVAREHFLGHMYNMLTSSYQQCKQPYTKETAWAHVQTMREKILTQICTLIGQFCIDEEYRIRFLDTFPHTCLCLLYIYEHSVPAGLLAAKALFALKQLCALRLDTKNQVGAQVTKKLLQELSDDQLHKSTDFVNQAVLLLHMLTGSRENCFRLRSYDIDSALNIATRPAWQTNPTKSRIEALLLAVRDATEQKKT